jgi:hypothetical protein
VSSVHEGDPEWVWLEESAESSSSDAEEQATSQLAAGRDAPSAHPEVVPANGDHRPNRPGALIEEVQP